MLTLTVPRSLCLLSLSCGLCACGSSQGGPNSPTPPSSAALAAPVPVSPVNNEQLATLKPTLVVQNTTAAAQAVRTYEFQISDSADFTAGGATINQAGVPEGADGRTRFTPPEDLQPATRLYWRSRVAQGSSTSDWSASATFKTKLVGYSRPGELYDPLIHGETIGTIQGSHTWIPGKGLQLDTQNSFVRYQLAEAMASGEFSVEVEGLHPNGPSHKLKVFSMSDTTGDTTGSRFQMSTMYRGQNGNPDNCIAFKAVFGSQSRIVEPDRSQRNAGIRSLDPLRTYFWKATWGNEFRLLVADGGVTGPTIYELGLPANGTYRPVPPYAYLGSNQSAFGSDAGTFPGATYRHLWIGNRPRPATLGNALE